MGRRGRDRDRMEVGFTTPYAIKKYNAVNIVMTKR
jgi:hypothetical protein